MARKQAPAKKKPRAKTKTAKQPRSSKPLDRVRRAPEHEQDWVSRHQLALCWREWPQQSKVEDLGEDLHFQIYAEGKSTGLSF